MKYSAAAVAGRLDFAFAIVTNAERIAKLGLVIVRAEETVSNLSRIRDQIERIGREGKDRFTKATADEMLELNATLLSHAEQLLARKRTDLAIELATQKRGRGERA